MTGCPQLIKPYEFWHPRLFEAPYYFYLGLQCLLRGIGVRSLAKANYALNHGEIGIGSKFQTQQAFDQQYFLPTILLEDRLSMKEKQAKAEAFIEAAGYPVILKSDVGCVGKGISKISSHNELLSKLPLLIGDYILQKFTPLKEEFGVFFTRHQAIPKITGINKKHFPTVIGNGKDTVLTLAKNHYRYTHHWHSFLQSIDTDYVPQKDESIRLSFIGSHTLGCKFTDDTHLLTPTLEQAVFTFFESQPGYNFGRFDVKTESDDTFQKGEFVVIEVNGIASLPTHMFDPKYKVGDAYKIFLQHANYLAKIAKENQHQTMELLPYRDIIDRVKKNQGMLNQVHEQLKR
jgi:hypothetical protein